MVIRVQPQRASFKPVPYQRSQSRSVIPAWLLLLAMGIVIGVFGVLFIQTSYGPKGLSATEAQKLTDELTSSNIERQRLKTEVESLRVELEALQQKPVTINTNPADK